MYGIPVLQVKLVLIAACMVLATISCQKLPTNSTGQVNVSEETPLTETGSPDIDKPTTIQPTGTNLSFTTIDQGENGIDGSRYEEKEPRLIVVGGAEDIPRLDSWISEKGLVELQTVDYETALAIAVFQGWKSSMQYGVSISHITQQDSSVTIYARFEEPRPDEETQSAETSPYHVVQVNDIDLRDRDMIFNLVVDGSVVASFDPNDASSPSSGEIKQGD